MSTYHPIGTVVRLTIDPDMLFAIAGYLPRRDGGKMFDYFAVPFPFGLAKSNQYILFNADRITEVVHMGYCDEEGQALLDGFDQLFVNLKKAASEHGNG